MYRDPDMRFLLAALLGVLMLCIPSVSIGIEQTWGQSAQIDNARSSLAQTFVLVQEADLQGATPGQISQLADNLNQALYYQENATASSSNANANMSLKLSDATAVLALNVANAARTRTLFDQAYAYSLAVAAGFGSALLVLEFHRLNDIVRKIRSSRIRLE
jgi:hypothetical protein